MKKNILCVAFAFAALGAYSQNGLDRFYVEKFYVSTAEDSIASKHNDGGILPVGSVTYRLYVDMKPGYNFQALFGTETHKLKIATTTWFYNHEDRGVNVADKSKIVNLKNNTVLLDSWFSVGGVCSDYWGVLKSEDTSAVIANADGVLKNTNSEMGIALTQRDGMMKTAVTPPKVTIVGSGSEELERFDVQNIKLNGDSLVTNDLSLASLDGTVGATTENRVLIGQFTTNGEFSYELNFQIGKKMPEGQDNLVEKYVARSADAQKSEYLLSDLVASHKPLVVSANPTITIAPFTTMYKAGDIVPIGAIVTGSVLSVEFFVDGVSLGAADVQAPFETRYTAVAGTHAITAKLTYANGIVQSAVVNLDVATINAIAEARADVIVCYPNPTCDNIMLQLPELTGDAYIYILSNDGVTLLSEKVTAQTIDRLILVPIVDFAVGTYQLRVTNDFGVWTKQIIKK